MVLGRVGYLGGFCHDLPYVMMCFEGFSMRFGHGMLAVNFSDDARLCDAIHALLIYL